MIILAKKIEASKEKPIMLCTTCGLATDKVIIRHSNTLRRVKRKTWKRTVKYSFRGRRTTYHNRPCRAKEIFFSYVMLDCIRKKHKISIRKAPFSSKLIIKLK